MRLIDADKLLADIEKYHVSDGKFQHWVQIQPTIEPERPPARWIEESDGWDGSFWTCSACGESMVFIDGGPEENGFDYCSHCGTKMEGVDALPGL